MKRIIALIMALALVMGLAITASATGYTISITAPDEVDTVTYKIYKVFDAVPGANGAISYTLMEGKTAAPAGFTVDAAGNVSYTGNGPANDQGGKDLTADDITAIKNYVAGDTAVTSVTATGGQTVTVSVPSAGYYYIATTSGSVVAVDSTNPNAQVIDKNEVPTLEKKILVGDEEVDATTASIGDTVTFQLTINIPENATGTLIVHDKMSEHLTFVSAIADTLDGFDVYNNPGDGCTRDWRMFKSEDYAGKTAVIQYTATVDIDAASEVEIANEAWIVYGGHESGHDIVTVINYKLTVSKVDGNNQPLAGAKFKLKDVDTDKYYNVDENGNVSWGTTGTEVEAVAVTDADGKTEYVATFKGLGNGNYVLEESTVPAGYNKAADQTIEIEGASEALEVVNNTGSELPSTGGIGTTLFYVIGGLMMTGAAVLLITKKRLAA